MKFRILRRVAASRKYVHMFQCSSMSPNRSFAQEIWMNPSHFYGFSIRTQKKSLKIQVSQPLVPDPNLLSIKFLCNISHINFYKRIPTYICVHVWHMYVCNRMFYLALAALITFWVFRICASFALNVIWKVLAYQTEVVKK